MILFENEFKRKLINALVHELEKTRSDMETLNAIYKIIHDPNSSKEEIRYAKQNIQFAKIEFDSLRRRIIEVVKYHE